MSFSLNGGGSQDLNPVARLSADGTGMDFCVGGASFPVASAPTPTLSGGSQRNILVAEGGTKVSQIVVSGGSGEVSIEGGVDGELFYIDDRNRLFFKQAPDYENPTDSNGDNIYEVIVEYGADRQTIRVTVRDTTEFTAPTSCPIFNPIPDSSNWMDFDISLMFDLIAGADCATDRIGTTYVARRTEFLYVALLGRAFDAYGLAYYINRTGLNLLDAAGVNEELLRVARDILNSEEFAAIAEAEGLLNPGRDLSIEERLIPEKFLTYLYNEMGREADEAGFNYWLGVMNELGAAEMLTRFAVEAVTPDDDEDTDALFLEKRFQLELAVLRLADEQGIALTEEQLKALKAALLANRELVLTDSLAPETLLAGLQDEEAQDEA